MKRLLQIIILTLSFETITKADDITDFQIEGISIGDSLLNFASEEKIKSAKSKNSQYPNDKYILYEVDEFIKTTKYDYLAITTKKNDKDYIVTSLSGGIYYNDLNECFEIRSQIRSSIEKLIEFDDVEEAEYKSQEDGTPIHTLQFYFKPYPSVEAIVLNCNHYSDDSGFKKDLSVAVNPEEYAYFLINEAYK